MQTRQVYPLHKTLIFFQFELIFTCTNGTIKLDSELNIITYPEEAILTFDGVRTESGKPKIELMVLIWQ